MRILKYLFLSLIIIMLLISCQKPADITGEEEKISPPEEEKVTEEEVTEEEVPEEIPSLKEAFKDDFYMGTAVEAYQLEDPGLAELIKKHYSSITAENAMKPEEIQPLEGTFDFRDADKIADFARENGIVLRGHTLIWHNQVPDWFFTEDGEQVSKETLRERMKTHITEVMQHYEGQIYAWDVVNEPIDADAPDGLLRNSWFEILGEEYIELAFRYAREADPGAKLFLNDFDTTNTNKCQAIVDLVKRLQEKDVPIDGIGMQMHISLEKPTLEDFEKTLQKFSELGLEIHITEMDISVYKDRTESFESISKEMLNEQGHRVKDLFDILDKYKDHITSITYWGITDEYSWLRYYFEDRKDWPLPFDEELKEKPFFWGMVDPEKLAPRINSAKAIQGGAEIDGIEDDIWQSAEYFPNFDASEDPGVETKALWNEELLYILLKVQDKSHGENGAVKIFLDEKNEKSDSLDENDRVVEFNFDSEWKNTGYAALNETREGYIFEARIPFEHIEGSERIEIGLDIQVTGGDGATVKWNDKDDIAGNIPKYWGTVDFVKAPKRTAAHYGTPEIDGVMDEEYYVCTPLPVETFIQGIEDEKNIFQGATATAFVLWDEDALYVYMEVNDPVLSEASDTVYMQDSIEVFVDENNNKTTFYQEDDGQYRVSYTNRQSFGSTGSVDGFESAAQIIEGGYAVEVKIPYRTITPQEGDVIGFDLQVNDDQGSGARDSITKWNDPTNNSWQSTAGLGILVLEK
jgi:endo-1,4-beta-xylanase